MDGEYDDDCVKFHNRVGLLFWRLGELDTAMEMFRVVLKMVEKKFGSDHLEMTHPLNNIANVLSDQGKHEEALGYYMKALVIEEKEYGRDHVEVATTLYNMGYVYRLQREYDKTIDTFNRVLVIHEENIEEKLLGIDNHNTVDTRKNIAILQKAMQTK